MTEPTRLGEAIILSVVAIMIAFFAVSVILRGEIVEATIAFGIGGSIAAVVAVSTGAVKTIRSSANRLGGNVDT